MDLIASLASAVGVDQAKATALAGGVLGSLKGVVEEKVGGDAAQQMDSAIPELGGWEQKAQAALAPEAEESGLGGLLGGLAGAAGGGSAGGLMGALAGAIGGEDAKHTVAVAGVLSGLGLDASKATLAAPVLYDFLKSRLSPDLLSKILTVAPLLAAVKGGGAAAPADPTGGALGAAAGMLGGMFGKK